MSNLTDPQITNGRPNSSMFHMPHSHSTTMDGGPIYPVACYESNPGDQVRMRRSNIIRVMPLVAPVGQDLWAFTASYRVPFHQVWANWPAFMAGMLSPDNEVNRPQLPTLTPRTVLTAHGWDGVIGSDYNNESSAFYALFDKHFGSNSLWARLGYYSFDKLDLSQWNIGTINQFLDTSFNALYLRANYHIWLNYYAHEWLDPERNVMTNNEYPYRNSDVISTEEIRRLFTQRYAPHERDYFTTCNPAPQKGSAVGIPGSVSASLKIADGGNGLRFGFRDTYNPGTALTGSNNIVQLSPNPGEPESAKLYVGAASSTSPPSGGNAHELSYKSGLDITGVAGKNGNSATMLDLAHAEHLQQWLEANSDYGNDYSDFIYGHFGLRPSGLGLMVPQRLAFSRQRIQISDIHQTGGTHYDSASERQNIAGDYAGRGFSSDGSHQYSYFEDLYSAVITHMWIRPETIYHGMHRRFARVQPADFFSPEFIADGDQPVYQYELSDGVDGTLNAKLDAVFGYNDRYGELKYEPSRVSGELRSSMNTWSFHRSIPVGQPLNTGFVYVKDFPDHIFAYEGIDKLEEVPRFVVYSHANMFARKFLPKVSRRSLMRS